ncbi:MAG: S26 family signal peptidase, partial [Pirellulales bacterium]
MFTTSSTLWGGGIRPTDRLRGTIHLAIGAFIWSIVLRTWLIRGICIPVVVSSGSMAPAFLGPHPSLACNRGGTTFAVGTDRSRPGGTATCPTCGNGAIAIDSATIRSGDRLIIDRSAFMLRAPRRWEAVLFREPEQAYRLAFKRIVGLPGESVRIEHGDVVVDGRICRKKLAEQRRVAQLVHRVKCPRHDSRPRWRSREKSSAWRQEETAFCYEPDSSGTGSSLAWLDYHHTGRHGVTDDMSYNPGESRLLSPVRDLMMVCQVTA